MAANGVDLGFGSPAAVLRNTAMMGAEDYAQLDRQSFQETKGYDISVANDRAQAQGKRQAASGAVVGGIPDVASTVLGGASQISKYRANKA